MNLPDFAALIGITPETHRHLFWPCCPYCDVARDESGCQVLIQDGQTYHCSNCADYLSCTDSPTRNEFISPALDTPEGDDVYLAPFLRWLVLNTRLPEVVGFNTGDKKLRFLGTIMGQAVIAETATAALLRACQSARVPGIVALFGDA